jgi:hypothetical protein
MQDLIYRRYRALAREPATDQRQRRSRDEHDADNQHRRTQLPGHERHQRGYRGLDNLAKIEKQERLDQELCPDAPRTDTDPALDLYLDLAIKHG